MLAAKNIGGLRLTSDWLKMVWANFGYSFAQITF
jgi:hypothetical protein